MSSRDDASQPGTDKVSIEFRFANVHMRLYGKTAHGRLHQIYNDKQLFKDSTRP